MPRRKLNGILQRDLTLINLLERSHSLFVLYNYEKAHGIERPADISSHVIGPAARESALRDAAGIREAQHQRRDVVVVRRYLCFAMSR